MPETGQSENPYLPVYLPEFGLSVGWAMCRNTMCQNFGIQYAGPAPAGAEEIKDDRYTIDTIEGKIRCGYCGNTFTLNSNRAIRTLARHFLSLSIPFATCENPECENFGLNVFEHLAPTRRRQGRPYWVKDAKKTPDFVPVLSAARWQGDNLCPRRTAWPLALGQVQDAATANHPGGDVLPKHLDDRRRR